MLVAQRDQCPTVHLRRCPPRLRSRYAAEAAVLAAFASGCFLGLQSDPLALLGFYSLALLPLTV